MSVLALLWPVSSPEGPGTSGVEASIVPVLWLAPASEPARKSAVAAAVDDLSEGRAQKALPVLQRAAERDDLGGYALLYLGRAQLALDRLDEARSSADRLAAAAPTGYLFDAAHWLAADVAEARADWSAAVASLRALAASKPLEPERVQLRLGQNALKANDTALAMASFSTVYYDHALSPEAEEAGAGLAALGVNLLAAGSPEEFARQLERAQQLYDAKRYTDARAAFAALRGAAPADHRALVELRLAACDYYLKRHAAANAALSPLVPQFVEAEFLHLSTLRELGRDEEYVARARAFVEGHPAHRLAEETLDNLGTHYLLASDHESAAAIFAEMYSRYPTGRFANRAAWKSGWWSYKQGEYAEAIRVFTSAAEAFPRDDYRPSWLYWAARAQQRLGRREEAAAGFRRVIADYRNSYYGRQATRAMAALGPGGGQVELIAHTLPVLSPGTPPPNAPIIQDLLAAGLYDTAILELRKAQAEFGSSPLLDATMAYALNRKGDLRSGIVRMRRAYPQFLAAGGELLPKEIRQVIFPVAYGDLISRHADGKNLDPYLMTALVAQESSFRPEVKSPAGAWGLMQIMPRTGRQVAARLRIRPFSTARLKQPEINVRIGMATFASLMSTYGGVVPALAAYNAGGSRVAQWLADRRDLEQDEFIDDIPFPETQNYVKRIIGTAEDYRALYTNLAAAASAPANGRPSVKAPAKTSKSPARKKAAPAARASRRAKK